MGLVQKCSSVWLTECESILDGFLFPRACEDEEFSQCSQTELLWISWIEIRLTLERNSVSAPKPFEIWFLGLDFEFCALWIPKTF